MSRSHLVPEVRVNKNGVPVTRHVKAPSAASGKKSKLPKLAAIKLQVTDREALINELLEEFDISANYGREYRVALRTALQSYRDSTLVLIKNSSGGPDPKKHGIKLNRFLVESHERVVREVMYHRPHLAIENPIEATETILGLHRLERFKEQKYLEEITGTELEIATAFTNITKALHEGTDAAQITYEDFYEEDVEYLPEDYRNEALRYIHDIALQELIEEHYKQADAIIRYINERHSAEPGAIREYLANGTVLHDGVL